MVAGRAVTPKDKADAERLHVQLRAALIEQARWTFHPERSRKLITLELLTLACIIATLCHLPRLS